MRAPEGLDPERDEAGRPEEALRLNKPLATAYDLEEDLRQFWDQPGKTFAGAFLTAWVRRAEASGVPMLRQMAKTLEGHRAGLLAYYAYPISTGPLEGTNNKIKTMKRQAYGFRDHEFFKLKILAIHEARYALLRVRKVMSARIGVPYTLGHERQRVARGTGTPSLIGRPARPGGIQHRGGG